VEALGSCSVEGVTVSSCSWERQPAWELGTEYVTNFFEKDMRASTSLGALYLGISTPCPGVELIEPKAQLKLAHKERGGNSTSENDRGDHLGGGLPKEGGISGVRAASGQIYKKGNQEGIPSLS